MRTLRTSHLRTASAIGGAALLLAASSAHAQAVIEISGALGLSVSLGQKPVFGIGADLRVMGFPSVSSISVRPSGLGGFAQVTWLLHKGARIAAGLHAGGALTDGGVFLNGELGWTYRTKLDAAHSAQHGIHLGVLGTIPVGVRRVLPAIDLPIRATIPLSGLPMGTPEFQLGAGVRMPSLFPGLSDCGVIDGRALRSEDGIHLPPVIATGSRPVQSMGADPATHQFLADMWIEQARSECASVPSFFALARDLIAVGAPESLTAAALAAAMDEVNHTALCCDLSAERSGLEVLPLVYTPPPPALCDRRDTLLRLAWESFVDGVQGEGAAAERARLAARLATDPETQAALRQIAEDEQRHAELSWAILSHCLRAGGSEVADAISEELRKDQAPPQRWSTSEQERDVDLAACQAMGYLPASELHAAWLTTAHQVQQRGEALLHRLLHNRPLL